MTWKIYIFFSFNLQALVVCLEDGGFLVLLHSSNFLSYEGNDTLIHNTPNLFRYC